MRADPVATCEGAAGSAIAYVRAALGGIIRRRLFVFPCAALWLCAALCVAGADSAAAQERVLRVALAAADAGALDPHRSSASQDVAIFGWMFNGLVRFPPGSADPARIAPDLAER